MTSRTQPYTRQGDPNRMLNNSMDVILAIRERLPELSNLAGRTSPVEDLLAFKLQIELLHDQLDLLVEASQIIIRATDLGKDIITAESPAIARALLELGTAALRNQEYFATATSVQILREYVDEVAASVSALATKLQSEYATKVDLNTLEGQVNSQIVAIFDRLNLLEAAASNIGALQGQVGSLANVVGGLGTQVNTLAQGQQSLSFAVNEMRSLVDENTLFMHTASTQLTNLSSRMYDTERGLDAQVTATQGLNTRVLATERGLVANSEQFTLLNSRITNQGETIDLVSLAQQSLSTQVSDMDGQLSANSAQITQLTSEIENLEQGYTALAEATAELTTSVEANSEQITILSEQVTSVRASLVSNGNQLQNASFDGGVNGWTIVERGPGWEGVELVRDLGGAAMVPEGSHTAGVENLTWPSGALCIQSSKITVDDKKGYIGSGYIAGENATVTIELRYFDASGQPMMHDGFLGQAFPGDGGPLLANWPRHSDLIMPPLGAATAALRVWVMNASVAPVRAYLLRPMLEEAVPGQLTPSPWQAGTIGITDSFAEAEERLTASIEANEEMIRALAEQVTELETSIGDGFAEALQELRTEVIKQGEYITALASNTTSLESRLGEKLQTETDIRIKESQEAWNRISKLWDDSVISPTEKPQLIIDYNTLVNELPGIITEAENLNITVEKERYQLAIEALVTYMALLTYPVMWNDTSDYTYII